jgi:predicted lipoprotein with Yx(FWY)xxD motif
MRTSLRIVILIIMLVSTISSNVSAIGLEKDEDGNNYLADRLGMPLYYFVNDDPNSSISNCYGGCSKVWIPLEETATSPMPSLLKLDDFSSIFRSDDKFQTTYKGRPLYTYIEDSRNGTPNGHGKNHIWFLIRP